jgi:hypothetical protein
MIKRIAAVVLICVSIFSAYADFAWKEAVDGDWTTADNWLGGLLPSYVSGRNVCLTNNSASYTVGLSNTTEQVIGGLLISGKSSTLPTHLAIENAALKVSGGRTVLTNGEIRVGSGGVFEMLNSTQVDSLSKGGRIILDGGTFIATNNVSQLYISSTESSHGALFRINSGNAYYKSINSKLLGIYNYARLEMSGGVLHLDNFKNSDTTINLNADSDTYQIMSLSGNAVIKILNGGAGFGRGVSTLSENASIEFKGNDLNYCSLEPYSSDNGRILEFNLKDNSSFKVSYAKFVFGKRDIRSQRCKCTLNISGGNHSFGRYCDLGCGHGIFNTKITGGHTEFKQYGLRIGAYPSYPSGTPDPQYDVGNVYACTSTVDVAGGVLYLNPDECHNDSARVGLWGVVVGYGAKGNYSSWFDGRLNISGDAIVTNGPAPLIVGAGKAVGSITQTGGSL